MAQRKDTQASHTFQASKISVSQKDNGGSCRVAESYEKPFRCQDCELRFRRLYDLKRHTKLHTGEQTHVCQKCGRKFARADTLARHARAERACVGRLGFKAGVVGEDGLIVPGLDEDAENGMDRFERSIDGEAGDIKVGESCGKDSFGKLNAPGYHTSFSSGVLNSCDNSITLTSRDYNSTPNMHYIRYSTLNTLNRNLSAPGLSPFHMGAMFASRLGSTGTADTLGISMPKPAPDSNRASGSKGGICNSNTQNSGNGVIVSRVLTGSHIECPPGGNQAHDAHNKPPMFRGLTAMSTTVPSQQQGQLSQSQRYQNQQQTLRGNQGGAVVGASLRSMRMIPIQGNANKKYRGTGFEGIWSYIKSLEDRVHALEDMVTILKQEQALEANITK
jgi:hypothetical protein